MCLVGVADRSDGFGEGMVPDDGRPSTLTAAPPIGASACRRGACPEALIIRKVEWYVLGVMPVFGRVRESLAEAVETARGRRPRVRRGSNRWGKCSDPAVLRPRAGAWARHNIGKCEWS